VAVYDRGVLKATDGAVTPRVLVRFQIALHQNDRLVNANILSHEDLVAKTNIKKVFPYSTFSTSKKTESSPGTIKMCDVIALLASAGGQGVEYGDFSRVRGCPPWCGSVKVAFSQVEGMCNQSLLYITGAY